MENFPETETELEIFSRKMEDDLISLIKEKGHNKSGKLVNSIKISFDKTSNGYKLNIKSKEYLKYLEEGDLLKDYLKEQKKELTKVIAKAIKKDIINTIKEIK